MDRTIDKKVWSILSYAKLPKIFWGEAMCSTIDIIYLSPAYTSEMDVSWHVCTEKDDSYKNVRDPSLMWSIYSHTKR